MNCKGKLINLEGGAVMGILNITPDSFYDGGNYSTIDAALLQAEKMLKEGATFIDVGGYSSRPGAENISVDDELKRVLPIVESISQKFPEAIISIDTFRADVAEKTIEAGAAMVNDIGGGMLDENMFATIAKFKVPYVLMHMQNTPENMQAEPTYNDVAKEVLQFLINQSNKLFALGVNDVIIDPGFGFGKTLEHNYQLLNQLEQFSLMGLPLLVGFSRKSMVNKVLGTKPENALNGTTVLNTLAMQKGASILRVHDVKEAMETLKIIRQLP